MRGLVRDQDPSSCVCSNDCSGRRNRRRNERSQSEGNRRPRQSGRRSHRSTSFADAPSSEDVLSAPAGSARRRSAADEEAQGSNRRRHNRRRRQRRRTTSGSRSARTESQLLATNAQGSGAPTSNSSDSNQRGRRAVDMTEEVSSAEEEASKHQIRTWPHNFSFLFACLSCTVGMFSLCRFATLTVDFGAVFLVQFFILSLLFGIPLLLFFVSIGQYLGSGIVDMWRISPIFQGIGVALMVAQGVYSVYNIAAIAWMFIYFRDSFITSLDRYRWSLCFGLEDYGRKCQQHLEANDTMQLGHNLPTGWRIEQTIPDYFAGSVLLRSSPTYPNTFIGDLRFQTLFNVVVVWMAVFIGLSKGVRSYGKVSYLFVVLSLVGFLIFAVKTIDVLPLATFKTWLANTEWLGIVYNGKSCICAARECFFTWGLLGATVLQLASHNRFKHCIIRDVTIIAVITIFVLSLSGLVGLSTVSLIRSSGYDYKPSSFETITSYGFLERSSKAAKGGRNVRRARFKEPVDYNLNNQFHVKPAVNLPPRPRLKRSYKSGYREKRVSDMEHISFLAGIRILTPDRNPTKYSGYQVMRLATELVPAYSAILGPQFFSPFWVVLFYFSMILFGISQQMALVHTMTSGLIAIKPDHFLHFETALTFMSCLLGLVFSFPLATEFGEFIMYFFDYTIGCGWWMMVLYVLQLFAVFVVRGKPYGGENVASILIKPDSCMGTTVITTLAFSWNVVLPIGLSILAIVSFRSGRFAEMFDWTTNSGYLYLPSWVREIGAMMQLLPILLVPFVAVIQSCRYFMNPSSNELLHERVNNLYRPRFGPRDENQGRRRQSSQTSVVLTNYNQNDGTNRHGGTNDPPPKYTPPPSYSTATGARIARFLRQSFRQSMRHIRGENEETPDSPQSCCHNLSAAETGSGDARRFPVSRSKAEPQDLESFGAYSLPPANDPPDYYATVTVERGQHYADQGAVGGVYAVSCANISELSSVSTLTTLTALPPAAAAEQISLDSILRPPSEASPSPIDCASEIDQTAHLETDNQMAEYVTAAATKEAEDASPEPFEPQVHVEEGAAPMTAEDDDSLGESLIFVDGLNHLTREVTQELNTVVDNNAISLCSSRPQLHLVNSSFVLEEGNGAAAAAAASSSDERSTKIDLTMDTTSSVI